MPFLERVELLEPGEEKRALFPFSVPAIAAHIGDAVSFPSPVTFLVGENGSGKSTLLEGIACAVGLPTIGSAEPGDDPTLAEGRILATSMKLRWKLRHPHRGYFIRAEDFFGWTKRMDHLTTELRAGLQAVQDDESLTDIARTFGSIPFSTQLRAVEASYGKSGFDKRSHGEQFLDLFAARCHSPGLYLMDEPEAPLSPARQLTFLSMLRTMSRQGAQFIIATHSPMLLALPGARILSFDGGEIRVAAYDTLEHVQILRTFLADPDAYLRHL